MAIECYGDEFEQYRTDLLRDEGSLEHRRLFEEFLRRATVVSGRCRQEFEGNPNGVEEDDKVFGPQCAKRE
jgi:hypothetical protein